ncbi:hypothetical protein [Nocardia tengchongensis]|uniref:hypothetical protein n=1 Tax=Nocardia tengchongensis TaxID=2055889 RepID=UPI003651F144
MATTFEQISYMLPAVLLKVGMSTDDGQDILDVSVQTDGTVFISVYTPRSDDPEQDEARPSRGCS